jgi:hypothetical protein
MFMDQFIIKWSVLIILRTMRSRGEWLLMMHIDYSVGVVEILLSLSVHRRNHWRDLYLYLPKSVSLWLYGGLFLFFLFSVWYIYLHTLSSSLGLLLSIFISVFWVLNNLDPPILYASSSWKMAFSSSNTQMSWEICYIKGFCWWFSADKNNFFVILTHWVFTIFSSWSRRWPSCLGFFALRSCDNLGWRRKKGLHGVYL